MIEGRLTADGAGCVSGIAGDKAALRVTDIVLDAVNRGCLS